MQGLGDGGGEGGRVAARVSEFFTKNPNKKNIFLSLSQVSKSMKKIFFGRGGGGWVGAGGGT